MDKHYKIKMKLTEFIQQFSHNNVVRLLHKCKGGHQVILDDWNDVCMDWEIPKGQGKFRHYADNQVLGLTTILFPPGSGTHHPEALNIVIENLGGNQPWIDDTTLTELKPQLESEINYNEVANELLNLV